VKTETEAAAPFTLDPANEVHARALSRLESETIAWFTSIRPDGMPHAVPVWFLWRDEEVLIMSEPATAKVRNLRGNDRALVHLESGEDGEQLTVLQGIATIDADPSSAWLESIGEEYGRKYAAGLAGLELTPRTMADRYSCLIRLRPTRLIAW
jgi:PPOX class probable F420-dependent enzyme